MAPCGWPTEPSAGSCSKWSTFDTSVQTTAAALATGFLYAATGRRFGPCEITVLPCQSPAAAPPYRTYPAILGFGDGGSSLLAPFIDVDGQVRNCGCGSRCCCEARCELELAGPVASISAVVAGGVEVPASSYRVDVQRGVWLLVRVDEICWPTCQDFNVPDPDFSVTYFRGEEIPAELVEIWGTLACEYGKALCGGGDCRLPARVQTMTRQGVTVEFEPVSNGNLQWQVGIPEVDAIVASLNPGRQTFRPVVYSPDLPTGGDRTVAIPAGS